MSFPAPASQEEITKILLSGQYIYVLEHNLIYDVSDRVDMVPYNAPENNNATGDILLRRISMRKRTARDFFVPGT
jgi:hypothetical protein